MGKIKRPIGERYDRGVSVEASHADRLNEQTLAHVINWLKGLGAALQKSDRRNVKILKNGHALLVVEYCSIGALLEAVVQLDGLRAMVQEDAAARAGRDGPQSH